MNSGEIQERIESDQQYVARLQEARQFALTSQGRAVYDAAIDQICKEIAELQLLAKKKTGS